MIVPRLRKQQQGVTLIVGMIMLTLITVMAVTAFQLSMGNQQAVGNMQFRDQALAAANFVLEQQVAGNLEAPIAAQTGIPVDLNGDGTSDILVDVAVPTCIAAVLDEAGSVSSLSLPGMTLSGSWNVLLDFDITARDAVTGASIRLRAGIRTLLATAQKTAWCAT